MASSEELMAIIGMPMDSVAIREIIAADCLIASSEEDLEEGEPVRSHLSSPTAGYQLLCEDGQVKAAFLFASSCDGVTPYASPLPGGLSPLNTRHDVLDRFGVPERSGDAFTDKILGRQGAWDRFVIGPVCVHFQYIEPDDRIRQVTLMLADKAP